MINLKKTGDMVYAKNSYKILKTQDIKSSRYD